MNLMELMATLSLDTSAYDSGLQQALASAEDFGGELESGVSDSVESAENSMADGADGMAGSVESAADSISGSADAMADSISGGADDASSAMDGLADTMGADSDDGISSLFDLGESTGILGGDFGNLASKAKDMGDKLLTALKTPMGAAVALTAAIAALTTAIIKGVNATAEYGDHVDKMSQKIGISASSYQQWDYVMQRAGTDVDNLKMGLKTLSNQASKNSDAFQELGISQEEVASLSKEDLFNRTVMALSQMEDGSKRTALASKLLGRAGADMAPLFNEGSEAIEEQMQIAKDYGMVMSDESVKASADFVDAGTTLKMTVQGMRNSLLDDFLPSLTSVKNGLAKLFSGDGEGAIEMLQGIGEFIWNAIKLIPTVIVKFAKGFGEAAVAIAKALGTALVEKVPELFNWIMEMLDKAIQKLSEWDPSADGGTDGAAMKFLQKLGEGFVKYTPIVLKAVGQIVLKILQALGKLSIKLLQLGVTALGKLLQGAVRGAVRLLQWFGQLPVKLLQKIASKLDQFFTAGGKIVKRIVSGAAQFVSQLPQKIGEMISNAKEKITSIDWLQLGKDIVQGLIDGVTGLIDSFISSMGSLASKGKEKFMSFFKFGSPSKVMKQFGEWIDEGLINGVDQKAALFGSAMLNLAEEGVSAFGEGVDGLYDQNANLGELDGLESVLTYSVYGGTQDTIAEAVNKGMEQIIPYMADSFSNAIEGMGISVDRYTYGKVVRKAAQGAL